MGPVRILVMSKVGRVTYPATLELDAKNPGDPYGFWTSGEGAQLLCLHSRKRPGVVSGSHEDRGSCSPQGLCTRFPLELPQYHPPWPLLNLPIYAFIVHSFPSEHLAGFVPTHEFTWLQVYHLSPYRVSAARGGELSLLHLPLYSQHLELCLTHGGTQ